MMYPTDDAIPKHKVFISFHHEDENYKKTLETQWGDHFDDFVSKAVGDGDIDPSKSTDSIRRIIREKFIADATVTLVLIGDGTWRRKHVDWEIASSLRDTDRNPRTGLLGILLPTYPYSGQAGYNRYTIPPRLSDNIGNGFAKIYGWPSSSQNLKQWIHDAFERRTKIIPDNSRDPFSSNISSAYSNWSHRR